MPQAPLTVWPRPMSLARMMRVSSGVGWWLELLSLLSLERYKERWNPKELSELARHLREFAESLEGQQGDRKKKAKE